jgi:hypothetical protein
MNQIKNKFKIYFRFIFFLKEIKIGLSRGAVGASTRNLISNRPISWEFSAFSQNGEDGVIDYLASQVSDPNKYFVEIGTSNGLANNTAYLALVKKYCGIMVEGNKLHSKLSHFIYSIFNKGVKVLNLFVHKDNIHELLDELITKSPDVFSLDIDGNDYYLAESILNSDVRPKIFVVEYNTNFGPDRSVTIPYTPNFDYTCAHDSMLYFGVSISAWKKLFKRFDYDFVTSDSNGINAFFILRKAFPADFVGNLEKIDFMDNKIEQQLFKLSWKERFKLISEMPLIEI